MRIGRQRAAIDSIVATVLVVAATIVASLAVSGLIFGVVGTARNPAQVAVTGTTLLASDFTAGGGTSTFTCATTASAAYLTLTNTGTGAAAVAAATITWGGETSSYTPSGVCNIGASGSAISVTYLIFPAGTKISPTAVPGQAYIGTVTLSSGARLLFTSNWQ